MIDLARSPRSIRLLRVLAWYAERGVSPSRGALVRVAYGVVDERRSGRSARVLLARLADDGLVTLGGGKGDAQLVRLTDLGQDALRAAAQADRLPQAK